MVDPDRAPELPAPGDSPPAAEAPTRTEPFTVYPLPTARRVVGSGLALALASTRELRRASIYIGLLVLGAFGPAIVATLLIVGRLGEGAADAFGAVLFGGTFGVPVQPALEAAMLVVVFEVLVGLLLFVSISIDAQVMAIAILGGRAVERPLRLWEAIIRARQTFWRMAGSGSLVGFVSVIVQGLIVAAIDGFSRSPEASGVVGALLSTLVIAPLAYVSTGIVLGDVGAMEALSRSWRLFKASRMLAVVVVLFTLVTSAIHLFAFSAGVDLVARAAELLQVSLTEGALAFLAAVVLILSAVVAYGSLTFTVGAVVAAPQVAGFLGLTFFSGGLDRARVDAPRPPPGFRYVSRPMTVAMLALAGIVALQVPAINSIEPSPTSASLDFARSAAASESELIEVYGYPALVTDARGDGGRPDALDLDLVQGEAAYVEWVPPWLLDDFDCGLVNVACGTAGTTDPFADGAYLFLHRLAGSVDAGAARRIVALLSLEGEVRLPGAQGQSPFGWASRAVTTELGATPSLFAQLTSGFHLVDRPTDARSTWIGTDVYTLIPGREIPVGVTGWDAVVLEGTGAAESSRDGLRAAWSDELLSWDGFAGIFIDDLRASPAP